MARTTTTVILLGTFLIASYLNACHSKILYLDSTATTTGAECTEKEPCGKLKEAMNRSEPGDTLLLAFGPRYPAYMVEGIKIAYNLSIKAKTQDSTPVIACSPGITATVCNIDAKTDNPATELTEVLFEDVQVRGCNICFKNASAMFDHTELIQAVVDMQARNQTYLNIYNSTFNDTTVSLSGLCNKPTKDPSCNYTSLYVLIKDTILTGMLSKFNLLNISDVDIHIQRSQFLGSDSQVKLASTHLLKLNATQMTVANFDSDTSGFTLDLTMGDLFGTISNSVFSNNTVFFGGALSLTSGASSHTQLLITDTKFQNNSCDTAGSAINMDLHESRKTNDDGDTKAAMVQTVLVDNCNFTHNSNDESAAAVYVAGGNVTITHSSFLQNRVTTELSVRTKSAERKGAGGAIYAMSSSNLIIDDCIFVNNTANWFGGAIGGNGAMTITNSYFEKSESIHSTLGEVLYLTGPVWVGNLTFNIIHADRNVPMIWYSGNEQSILQGVGDGYINFNCPAGSQFRNESLPEFDKGTAYRDLFYFCEPCTDETYSLLHGYRVGPLDVTYANFSSFECLPCSYGGVCKQGQITAQYNFWGYAQDNPPQVSMLMCPESYCCQSAKCGAYNTCAANRTGTLCGQCKKGMSEMLFSTECVDNKKCNDVWVFAVDLIASIVTLLFFLYQLEIMAFVCKYLFWADVSENDDPTFAGYIKSIFYFYQTVDLLKVQDNEASKIVGIAIQPIISYLLSFKSIAIIFGACPFPGMNPVSKTIWKSMPTIYVLSFIGILTLIYTIIQYSKGKQDQSSYVQFNRQVSTTSSPSLPKRSLGSRLASACLSYFLFNYISISNMTFTLLACTPVGDKSVLFIDGNVQCIQPWQSIFILIAIFHVCPFFMAVMVSRYLYDRNKISTQQFFMSYFLPLPMLSYWGVLYMTRWKKEKGMVIEDAMTESLTLDPKPSLSEDELLKASILGMVEEPFVNHSNAESARYWEGILIFRRLVLSAITAFTVQPLLGITLQTFTCFGFLLWHVHVHPFGTKAANNFETASLSVLTIVAICHVIQATLLSSGIPAIGPNKTQIFITDWIEWILVNLLPMLLGLAFIVFLIVRLFMAIGSLFKYMFYRATDSRDRTEYSSPF